MGRFVRIVLAAALAVTVPPAADATLAAGTVGVHTAPPACCCGDACACTAANSCGCVVRAPDAQDPQAATPAATATGVASPRAAGLSAAPWSASLPAETSRTSIVLRQIAASRPDSGLRQVVVLQV